VREGGDVHRQRAAAFHQFRVALVHAAVKVDVVHVQPAVRELVVGLEGVVADHLVAPRGDAGRQLDLDPDGAPADRKDLPGVQQAAEELHRAGVGVLVANGAADEIVLVHRTGHEALGGLGPLLRLGRQSVHLLVQSAVPLQVLDQRARDVDPEPVDQAPRPVRLGLQPLPCRSGVRDWGGVLHRERQVQGAQIRPDVVARQGDVEGPHAIGSVSAGRRGEVGLRPPVNDVAG